MRKDAGSISAATACPSVATCCSVTGFPTGAGLSSQPLRSAQASAPRMIRPIIGNRAFIKLPSFSSSRCKGAVLVVSEMRSPTGTPATMLAGTTALAHEGI